MKLPATLPFLILSLLCGACADRHAPDTHHHDEAHAEEFERGPHGGRLLEQDDLTVELAIAEAGTPPRYKAWLYRNHEPLPPAAGAVEVRLRRLGDVTENHRLEPREDGSLMAPSIVGEPHSFDVEVLATVDGKALRWAYPSYEGRTTIAAGIAQTTGIRTAPAGPGTIADDHVVQGLLTTVEGSVATVAARFPGPIRRLHAGVGDRVRAGQVLATIESNLSLADYEIMAPLSGVVLARHATPGAVATEGAPLYEIADLSKLWVDLHLFGGDAQHIRAGVPVEVTRLADGATASTRLERVLPGTATASQSTVARATIANEDGQWRPGAAVMARLTVEQHQAALVVPLAAVQGFRDWDVVFIRIGDTYEARPVELGRRDARQVEILGGIDAGDEVVVEQSYLVKADIEKSGATHEH